MQRLRGVMHRKAVTAADVLGSPDSDDIALSDVTTGGSLTANTDYYGTAIAGNSYGCAQVSSTIETVKTANDASDTHIVRMAIAKVTGAEHYDIFMSTDAAPKWVARITEAQRAAGKIKVTAVATVAADANVPAQSVDIYAVGTGLQTSNDLFKQANAFVLTDINELQCQGKEKAYVHVSMSVTDLRSVPSLTVIPFLSTDEGDYSQGTAQAVTFLSAAAKALQQVFTVTLDGAKGLKVAVSAIAGQDASVNVWVELV